MEPACPACARRVRPRDFLCPNCRWRLQGGERFADLREALEAAIPDPLGFRWAGAANRCEALVARCDPDGQVWLEKRTRCRGGVHRALLAVDEVPGWAQWTPLDPWPDALAVYPPAP